jgi:hypothetical protein
MDCSPTDVSLTTDREAPRDSVKVQRGARAALACVAVCLLVPLAGALLQDKAALEEFHNRTLHAWPRLSGPQRGGDPVQYLRGARDWLADRVFPIMAATRLQTRAAYYLLHEAPSPRITLGKDGHIFVNGADDKKVFWFFDAGCLTAHDGRHVRALERDLKDWARVAHRRQLQVDVVRVPTSASIHADKLPESVPRAYREGCLQRMAGQSPLLDVQGVGAVSFVYPLREMLAARADPAFFPRGNWHPSGLSLQVARNAYLAKLGLPGPTEETLELGSAPAEALESYGIDQQEPIYALRDPHVTANTALEAELRRQIEELFQWPRFVLHVYENDRPPTEQSVLMLSDSFGDLSSRVFAGGFRRLIQINTNELKKGFGPELIDRLQRHQRFERLILLTREGNERRLSGLLSTERGD